MFFINPKAGELFFQRLLLCYIKGATTFDDLRTIDRVLLGWKEVYIALGLWANDQAARDVLYEALSFATGYGMRYLFVSILTELEPTDVSTL